MVVWFSVLAVLGGAKIVSEPGVLRAVNPVYAALRHNEALHERVIVASVEEVGDGVHQVVLDYGFMEEPDVPHGLGQGAAGQLAIDGRNATPAAVYFNLPLSQTIILGTAIEL